jgi:hypothetical protein
MLPKFGGFLTDTFTAQEDILWKKKLSLAPRMNLQ